MFPLHWDKRLSLYCALLWGSFLVYGFMVQCHNCRRLVTLNYRILSETGTLSYCIFLLFPPLFSLWRISCSSCNCDFILFSLLILFFLLYCSFLHRYAYKLFIFIFFFFLTCLLIFFSQLQDWNNRRQFTSPSDFHADGVNDFFISQVWSLPTIVL
jgi:hypothetical protein